MKAKTCLFMLTMLLVASMAFAVNGSGYYTLTKELGMGMFANSVLYLKQESKKATVAPMGRQLVASVPDTPEELYNLLDKYWVKDLATMSLRLETSIDLGQIGEDGQCVTSHTPLPYRSGAWFYGQGKTVSNMCISVGKMTSAMGFFELMDEAYLENLKMDGVKIMVNAKSDKGEDFYPVGSLAGRIVKSTISNFVISNVEIDAPFAGGVVGVIDNSTMKVTAVESVSIVNNTAINSGYAGSKFMGNGSSYDVNGSDYGYNVFLGGVTAVAIRVDDGDLSFIDSHVAAEIRNVPATNNSVLGGIAGLFVAKQDGAQNVKAGSAKGLMKISGGSSMGGLFGFVGNAYENNAPVQGTITIETSSFNGEIDGASVGGVVKNGSTYQEIYVGGLVGKDSLGAQSRLIITDSRSEITLVDSMTVAGNYYYTAGGILGASNRCTGVTDDSVFVTIKNSKSSGKIQIAGSGKDVDGLHIQTFVGGIAGDVCLASSGEGLAFDTSSVAISVNTKTSWGDLKHNGMNVFDTVVVGGVVGFLNSATKKFLPLNNVRYEGSVEISDSLNTVVAGGIVGMFPALSGGTSVDFNNVFARSETLVKLNAVATEPVELTYNDKQVAKIAGVCGYCRELHDVQKVAVAADVVASGTFAGDTLLVGGMVAQSHNTNDNTSIRGVFSVGDILANVKMSKASAVKNVGYLVADQRHTVDYSIASVFHYGENDLDVGPFGGQDVIDVWADNANIDHVVRNGASRSIGAQSNGTEISQTMHSKMFAGFLNEAFAGSAEDPYIWSFDPGYNGNLPFIAHDGYKPVPPQGVTTYSVSFWGMDKKLIGDAQTVIAGESAVAPEAPKVEGYTFSKWDKDFSVVMDDMNVNAIYVIDTFTVTFWASDDEMIGEPQRVVYGESAEAPNSLEKTGHSFMGWNDSSYAEVKKDLDVYAVFMPNIYTITYMFDADSVIEMIGLEYGSEIVLKEPVKKLPTEKVSYKFDKWVMDDGTEIPELMPDSDLVLLASFSEEDVLYTVSFVGVEGGLIGSVQKVKYGASAVAPKAPAREGSLFVGWDVDFSEVTENLKVTALYDTIMYEITFRDYKDSILHQRLYPYHFDMTAANAMACERKPSAEYVYTFKGWSETIGVLTKDMDVKAVYDSTFIAISSSSSEEILSSSSEPSSSSSVIEESSSSEKLEIASSKLDVSGSAIRYRFDVAGVNEKTLANIVVKGNSGVVVDTVLDVSALKSGEWMLVPAPKGNYAVDFVVTDGQDLVSDSASFEVKSEIATLRNSWQMVASSALETSKFDKKDVSLYWWDEQNPAGDFWQYRAYAGEETKFTRGFWYGTIEGSPIKVREPEGPVSEELVWELDSLYSGWNLVANPYGWYISLKDGAAGDCESVEFWHWNGESGYEIPEVVAPYGAVWAKVKKACTYRVSTAPVFDFVAVASRGRSSLQKAARKASAGEWSLMVSLSDENGRVDSWNVLGASAFGETMSEPPVGMGERVTLAIRENAQGKKLAKSIKPVADSYEWILDVSANRARDGRISFDGVDQLNELGYSLFVVTDGRARELKAGETLPVALAKTSEKVTVRVAKSGGAVVASNSLKGFATSQNGAVLQASFLSPEALAGAAASYTLVDVKGTKIASGSFTAKAGQNVLNLKAPKSGLYFMQVKIASQKMNAKVFVK